MWFDIDRNVNYGGLIENGAGLVVVDRKCFPGKPGRLG